MRCQGSAHVPEGSTGGVVSFQGIVPAFVDDPLLVILAESILTDLDLSSVLFLQVDGVSRHFDELCPSGEFTIGSLPSVPACLFCRLLFLLVGLPTLIGRLAACLRLGFCPLASDNGLIPHRTRYSDTEHPFPAEATGGQLQEDEFTGIGRWLKNNKVVNVFVGIYGLVFRHLPDNSTAKSKMAALIVVVGIIFERCPILTIKI